MVTETIDYPVRFNVDYPEEPRNRLTALLRVFLVIPILAIVLLLSGGVQRPDGDWQWGRDGDRSEFRSKGQGIATGGGIVIVPAALMLLFRRKYPRWWFDWNREFYRFGSRVSAYLLLLRDEYPSTDEEQAVHLEIDYPDATRLNRWLPLVKWLLAIPHYVVLIFLGVAVVFVTLFSWLAILITGRYPRSLFDFVVGAQRWGTRVSGYAFLLVTDRYPPFSLS